MHIWQFEMGVHAMRNTGHMGVLRHFVGNGSDDNPAFTGRFFSLCSRGNRK